MFILRIWRTDQAFLGGCNLTEQIVNCKEEAAMIMHEKEEKDLPTGGRIFHDAKLYKVNLHLKTVEEIKIPKVKITYE